MVRRTHSSNAPYCATTPLPRGVERLQDDGDASSSLCRGIGVDSYAQHNRSWQQLTTASGSLTLPSSGITLTSDDYIGQSNEAWRQLPDTSLSSHSGLPGATFSQGETNFEDVCIHGRQIFNSSTTGTQCNSCLQYAAALDQVQRKYEAITWKNLEKQEIELQKLLQKHQAESTQHRDEFEGLARKYAEAEMEANRARSANHILKLQLRKNMQKLRDGTELAQNMLSELIAAEGKLRSVLQEGRLALGVLVRKWTEKEILELLPAKDWPADDTESHLTWFGEVKVATGLLRYLKTIVHQRENIAVDRIARHSSSEENIPHSADMCENGSQHTSNRPTPELHSSSQAASTELSTGCSSDSEDSTFETLERAMDQLQEEGPIGTAEIDRLSEIVSLRACATTSSSSEHDVLGLQLQDKVHPLCPTRTVQAEQTAKTATFVDGESPRPAADDGAVSCRTNNTDVSLSHVQTSASKPFNARPSRPPWNLRLGGHVPSVRQSTLGSARAGRSGLNLSSIGGLHLGHRSREGISGSCDAPRSQLSLLSGRHDGPQAFLSRDGYGWRQQPSLSPRNHTALDTGRILQKTSSDVFMRSRIQSLASDTPSATPHSPPRQNNEAVGNHLQRRATENLQHTPGGVPGGVAGPICGRSQWRQPNPWRPCRPSHHPPARLGDGSGRVTADQESLFVGPGRERRRSLDMLRSYYDSEARTSFLKTKCGAVTSSQSYVGGLCSDTTASRLMSTGSSWLTDILARQMSSASPPANRPARWPVVGSASKEQPCQQSPRRRGWYLPDATQSPYGPHSERRARPTFASSTSRWIPQRTHSEEPSLKATVLEPCRSIVNTGISKSLTLDNVDAMMTTKQYSQIHDEHAKELARQLSLQPANGSISAVRPDTAFLLSKAVKRPSAQFDGSKTRSDAADSRHKAARSLWRHVPRSISRVPTAAQ